jgi:hypothetical protein
VVYNLRIAETSRRQAQEEKFKKPSIFAVGLVNQWNRLRDNSQEDYTSGLATINYSTKSAYIHADIAVGNVRQKTKSHSFSRTQMDDILITGGYGFKLNHRSRITFSGLLGIPTHKDLSPEGLQFGTGHVGVGLQMDGSFFYSPHYNNAILAAARYIHFFPRTIEVPIPLTTQIQKVDYNIGNAIDLFISHFTKWHRNRFEFGYNPTFIFGATSCPFIATLIEQSKLIRSNFFGNYRRLFRLGNHPSGVGVGLSYGFDHSHKEFASKRVITAWIGWGINF